MTTTIVAGVGMIPFAKPGSSLPYPEMAATAVRKSTAQSKSVMSAAGYDHLTELTRHAPEMVMALAGRAVSRVRMDLGGLGQPMFNVLISNVPGNKEPLHMLGAELKRISAVGPIVDGLGLIFAVCTYAGGLELLMTACRTMVPDPDRLATCMRESVEEMNAAVAASAGKNRGAGKKSAKASTTPARKTSKATRG